MMNSTTVPRVKDDTSCGCPRCNKYSLIWELIEGHIPLCQTCYESTYKIQTLIRQINYEAINS